MDSQDDIVFKVTNTADHPKMLTVLPGSKSFYLDSKESVQIVICKPGPNFKFSLKDTDSDLVLIAEDCLGLVIGEN